MHPPPDPRPRSNVRDTLLAGAIGWAVCTLAGVVLVLMVIVGILAETAL